jgi:hypothetical protein
MDQSPVFQDKFQAAFALGLPFARGFGLHYLLRPVEVHHSFEVASILEGHLTLIPIDR